MVRLLLAVQEAVCRKPTLCNPELCSTQQRGDDVANMKRLRTQHQSVLSLDQKVNNEGRSSTGQRRDRGRNLIMDCRDE
ncbi:uncharacterized protein IUM83_04528 [Phytophthora cinnamomi]|uniref:uncharacterized protein n=1 Tax=Phytophthora cinnamomi TaxID=4785 RepID=UPI0035593E04|nr:hypothetical protein IUM83_04528 [Phytophthora cinnamomi]